jgi:hypothetical protein
LALRVCFVLIASEGAVGAGAPLSLSVSPTQTPAPGFVSVRAIVEANDENRALEIVAESPEYIRSSTIQLDGHAAPRVSLFEFRNLPPGFYDITALLLGTHGKRAGVKRVVRIVPTAAWHDR